MATLIAGGTALTVDVVTVTADRDTRTVLHAIVGRADPLPSYGVTTTRTGTITVHCATRALAEAIVVHCQSRRVLLGMPEHPSLDGMPIAVTGHTVTPWERLTGGWAWRAVLDYTEIA